MSSEFEEKKTTAEAVIDKIDDVDVIWVASERLKIVGRIRPAGTGVIQFCSTDHWYIKPEDVQELIDHPAIERCQIPVVSLSQDMDCHLLE